MHSFRKVYLFVIKTSYSAISFKETLEGYKTQNSYENVFLFTFFLQWKGVSQRQACSSVINFDALAMGLQRLSTLLSKTLDNDGRQGNSLNVGTYVPYRVNSETCKVFVVVLQIFIN